MDGGENAGLKSFASLLMLAGLLAVSGVMLPFIGIFPALFLPLPMLLLRLENETVIPACLLAGMVLTLPPILLGRMTPDMFFYGGMLLYGFMMGEGWRRGKSKEIFVTQGILTVLLAGILGVLILSLNSGKSPFALISTHIAANLNLTLEIYRQMEMPEETLALFEASLPRLEYALTRLLPAIMATLLILAAWLNLLAARSIVRHRKTAIPDLGFFMNWGVPPFFIWGFIVTGLILLLPVPPIRILGLSCLLLLLPLYFLQGMAITAFWFQHRRVPPLIRYTLYALMLIQQILILLILLIGIFDTWLNFRKRIQTTPTP